MSNGKSLYFRFDDANKMSYKYILSITQTLMCQFNAYNSTYCEGNEEGKRDNQLYLKHTPDRIYTTSIYARLWSLSFKGISIYVCSRWLGFHIFCHCRTQYTLLKGCWYQWYTQDDNKTNIIVLGWLWDPFFGKSTIDGFPITMW